MHRRFPGAKCRTNVLLHRRFVSEQSSNTFEICRIANDSSNLECLGADCSLSRRVGSSRLRRGRFVASARDMCPNGTKSNSAETKRMTLRTWLISAAACMAAIAPGGSNALSREIHVSETGSDSGPGSQARPYLTINKAASVAQPGDTVTVHAGTYREWVKPPRGGTGEEQSHHLPCGAGRDVVHQRLRTHHLLDAARRAASGKPNCRTRSSATTIPTP